MFNRKTNTHNLGFTIIELLIVIVVIGILATLVLNTVGTARKRADAAQIASTLEQTKKSLIALASSEGRETWWSENELEACDSGTVTANPYLAQIVEGCPGFDDFLQNYTLEDYALGSVQIPRYDNEGDGPALISACGSLYIGTNLYGVVIPPDIAEEVDQVIDGGDGSTCGSFKWSASGSISYRIGTQNNIQ